MVEVCRARGLDVTEEDAVGYLERQADASLGGLFAAQVVEHLQPAYLLRFLELAFHKLRPGAPIVLETLNPACWTAFFDSFIRDITHVWPLHPETLRYLVLASGFSAARIEYRSPVPPQDRLQPAAAAGAPPDLVEAFNTNIEKLNARLFSFLDYAIVGRR
jgi:O-antigen chain-terminating methyltransferase